MDTGLIDAISALPMARRLGLRSWLERAAKDRGLEWVNSISDTDTVSARIEHGRWIADCKNCAGAENVTADDPVMYCLSCGNEHLDGRLAQVQFPDAADWQKIEELLLARPRINQNWDPAETVEFLRDENRMHSVAKEFRGPETDELAKADG